MAIETEKISSKLKTLNNNNLLRAISSIKEEVKNTSFFKESSLNNSKEEKQFKLSNAKRVIKSDQNKFNQLYSENICGNFTLKKESNILKKFNSEEERFKKIKKKLSERNNNINKRVKVFVPAKEYVDLLEEIDAEETEEMKNVINNVEINDNSEEEKLNNFIIHKMLSASNKFNTQKNDAEFKKDIDINKKNILNKNIGIEDRNKNKIIDKNSSIYDVKYKLEKVQEMEKCIKNSNINNNIEQKNFKQKRRAKFLKIFEDEFTTFATDIHFKYGEYENDKNKYTKSILIIIKTCLYVFKINSQFYSEKQGKLLNNKNLLINNIKNNFNISFPLLYLDFNLISCILLLNKDKTTKEFQIKIIGINKSFSFILQDETEFNKYIFLIGGIIHSSEGYKQNKLCLSFRNNIFYKKIYITPLDFELTAKTGDILLFKSMDKCADLQRLYTCDSYDHVGIVYKENNKIQIFESTSMGKCTPLSWNYFKILFFNLVYHKIAFRQLFYENENQDKVYENEKILEGKIKNFFEEIEGKNYYLSITKFLCCQKPEDYEFDKNFGESEGFCCSALAAALYVKIGVAKLQKSVHSTKPGDFEQKRNRIFFEKGYFLGPEKLLDFSE